MNFSMMFKRNVLLAICILGIASFFPLKASCAKEELSSIENPGEILLVYDDNPDARVCANIERIVHMASAMGKIIDYGSVSECTDVLERYPYMICLDLHKTTEAFEERFCKSNAKRMIIGSSFMKNYLLKNQFAKDIQEEKIPEKGRLVYEFESHHAYEELVETEELVHFKSSGYENGAIYSNGIKYPFCSQVREIRFVALTDFETKLSGACLMKELQEWMWPYKDTPPDYAQYLVLDGVYPFMPADELMETVVLLEEQQIPYVISVMPIEEHGDYPAMKQFCQVLSYAQKNHGMIILHAPIIHKEVTDLEELYEKLTAMTMNYVENGIYPMGIEVPYSWTNQEIYLEALQRYRTVFVYDDGKDSGFSTDEHTNVFCRQGHQLVYPLIWLDQSGVSQLRCYSSAAYVDASVEKKELLQLVENNRASANPFMNLWDISHSVWVNDYWINYQDHILYLNEERTEITYEPIEYDEEYDYGRDTLHKISVNLQNQNKVLMAVVVIVIILFASFIVYARIKNRRRFLYQKRKEDQNDNC